MGTQLGRVEAVSDCGQSYERSKDMARTRAQDTGLGLGHERIQQSNRDGWR